MKKIILFSAFSILSVFAFSAKVTITNSGFTFAPVDVTINVDDTVIFQLAGSHNAVEVSQATWNANGNTPLPGGFSVGFGGGQVTGLAQGTYYYVCTPHASFGMKGTITVVDFTGIDDPGSPLESLYVYPNPTSGIFTFRDKNASLFTGGASVEEEYRLEIYNLVGERILAVENFIPLESNEIDLSSFPAGAYFVRINDRKNVYTQKLIVQ